MNKKFVVFDLETTGHSPTNGDQIIDIGLVVIENDQIIKQYSTLINPHQPIPSFITHLTGIKNEDVEHAPSFHEIADDISHMFYDSYLIAHNILFDKGFINDAFAKIGMEKLKNKVLDTVELSRIFFPKAPSYQLGQLAEFLQIEHDQPHRALSDAYVTANLFLKIKDKISSLPNETISHLLTIGPLLQSDFDELLREQLHKPKPNINNKIHSFNGLAFQQPEDNPHHEAVNAAAFGHYLDDIYKENGTLQQHLNKYEKRTSQREMSELIYDSFQIHQHAFIEASTGTGKTLAYLIPAVYEAINNNERVFISTHTTQLQSQLIENEITLVRKLIPFHFNAVILKGKSHYISLERFSQELQSTENDNYDIALTKAKILVWLTETNTGDINEIQLPSSGYFYFKKISALSEDVNNPSSPWFKFCYYQKAKRNAQQADIVIVNHALLCTDILNDYTLLPSYQKVIIDEAHHLEGTISKQSGLRLDYISMHLQLSKLGTTKDNYLIKQLFARYDLDNARVSNHDWDDIFTQTKIELDDFFRLIYNYVRDRNKNNKSFNDIGRLQYRFINEKERNSRWDTITGLASNIVLNLKNLTQMLTSIIFYLDNEETLNKYDEIALEENLDSIQMFIDKLNYFFLSPSEDDVKWVEIEEFGAKNAVFLYSEQTNSSTILLEKFFKQKQSVVMTSATLTIRKSFSYIKESFGLKNENIITASFKSPFSYKDQLQLFVPNDFPSIDHKNNDEYIYSTCEAILSLSHVTNGRMLVLFTSYEMLKKSYYLLKDMMEDEDFSLIAQGISSGSRMRLLKNFQNFNRAILLGTSSFWEGVDIPGEDLSCLMIVKLPFQPPNHPLYQAKADQLKDEGKNPFYDLALPHAVLRFKQGFGRLIRSTHDKGIVFVCDSRMVTSRYSKFFIESIPNIPIVHDSTYHLVQKAEKFFEKNTKS